MKISLSWRHLWIALLIITAFTIMYFSHQTGEVSSLQSNYMKKNISQIVDVSSGMRRKIFVAYLRKSAHFFLYALLGFFTGLSIGNFNRKNFFLSSLGIFLFAISDEFHQSFVPGREAKITDVGIDFLGGLAGIVLVAIIVKIIDKRG